MLKPFVCLFFIVGLLACHQSPTIYSQTAYMFGTKVDISIWGSNDTEAQKHIACVFHNFEHMHRRLHAWQPSDLMQLNAAFATGQTAIIDQEMMDWLHSAQHYENVSDHLFNPATGQLIKAWGFHQDTYVAKLPENGMIHKWVAAKPSLHHLTFTPQTVKSDNSAVSLDFGGIAKGWALDRAAAYLRKNHVNNALINIGGNVLALGRKGDVPWTVGLQDPRAPEPIATISLNDGEAIGTSGDYQRYFVYHGQRYSHLLDPRTGKPALGVMSATIIAPASPTSGTVSDVATKPLFIGGIASAPTYLQRFALQNALIITSNNDAYITPSLQKRLTWLRKPAHIYTLKNTN